MEITPEIIGRHRFNAENIEVTYVFFFSFSWYMCVVCVCMFACVLPVCMHVTAQDRHWESS